MEDMDGIYNQPLDDMRLNHNRLNGVYREFLQQRPPSGNDSMSFPGAMETMSSNYTLMNHLLDTSGLPTAIRELNHGKYACPTPILNRRKPFFRSDTDVNIKKIYEKGLRTSRPLVEHSFEGQSSHFIFKSEPTTYSSTATQTEQSAFEEKFLIRETILLGCDLVSEISCFEPSLSLELQECADYVREKMIQSQSQDVCSRLLSDDIDSIIAGEYIKTFMRISDAWLEARNCFGLSAQCVNDICNLKARRLSHDYLEWVHASRKLMESIVQGMEWTARGPNGQIDLGKTMCLESRGTQSETQIPRTTVELHQRAVLQQRPKWAVPPCQPEGPGGFWGYPPIPPCHCGLNAQPVKDGDSSVWYSTAQTSIFPPTITKAQSAMELGRRLTEEILKPGSYNVERAMITPAQKRVNILKAQSTCCQDLVLNRGYVVTFTHNKHGTDGQHNKDSGSDDNDSAKDSNTHVKKRTDEWVTKSYEITQGREMSNGRDGNQFEQNDREGDSHAMCDKGWLQLEHSLGNKKIHSNIKRRRFLSQKYLSNMHIIIQELGKCDWPDGFRIMQQSEETKFSRPNITLETIAYKTKHTIYETIEQFVHDCRNLLSTATNYYIHVGDKNIHEKLERMKKRFELLLENHFEQSQNWNYITGEAKELAHYASLKYINSSKKRVKTPRNISAENF